MQTFTREPVKDTPNEGQLDFKKQEEFPGFTYDKENLRDGMSDS